MIAFGIRFGSILQSDVYPLLNGLFIRLLGFATLRFLFAEDYNATALEAFLMLVDDFIIRLGLVSTIATTSTELSL